MALQGLGHVRTELGGKHSHLQCDAVSDAIGEWTSIVGREEW